MVATKPTTQRRPRQSPRFVLVDAENDWTQDLRPAVSVSSTDDKEIRHLMEAVGTGSLWISSRSDAVEKVLSTFAAVASEHTALNRRLGDLLMLEPPRPRTLPILYSLFSTVIGETSSFKFPPLDELAEVLSAPPEESADLFIAGAVDAEDKMLTLVRGNLQRLSVPLTIFRPSGTTKPNFRRFSLGDYGHTIRFGDYEASTDYILYQCDREYRRKVNANRRDEEKGFGPSLRRLRKLRRVSRDDFPGISEKEIARIERGEVDKPHSRTLRAISKTLKVSPEEIETY